MWASVGIGKQLGKTGLINRDSEMIKLTFKQEAFVQAVANGKSQSDAYRSAYNAKKMKPETIWENASRLMSDSKVATRLNELKEQLAKQELWTREDSVRTLKEVLADPEARAGDRTGAIKVLNEMHGYNAPKKLEHSGPDGGAIPQSLVIQIVGFEDEDCDTE